jgi:hypothetical protein
MYLYLTLLATACMARALSTEGRQHDLTAPAILPPATGGEDAGDAIALQVRPAALHRTKGGGTERKGIDERACRGQRRRRILRSTCPHLKVPPLCHPAVTHRGKKKAIIKYRSHHSGSHERMYQKGLNSPPPRALVRVRHPVKTNPIQMPMIRG